MNSQRGDQIEYVKAVAESVIANVGRLRLDFIKADTSAQGGAYLLGVEYTEPGIVREIAIPFGLVDQCQANSSLVQLSSVITAELSKLGSP
jgi:hypothetical protein